MTKQPQTLNYFDAPPAPATGPTDEDYVVIARAILAVIVLTLLFASVLYALCARAGARPAVPEFSRTLPRVLLQGPARNPALSFPRA